jgi:hypothetical protein
MYIWGQRNKESRVWVHLQNLPLAARQVLRLRNSWIQLSLQNESVLNKSLSMNVFQMRGMAFIPDKVKPDIDRESDAKGWTV